MIAAVASELRKLFSTRLWWILLICAGVYLALVGGLMAGAFGFAANRQLGDSAGGGAEAGMPTGDEAAFAVYSLAGSMGYVFPLLVGVLAVTAEYRHKTITPTFLVEPRRCVVLGAKLIASVPMGLAYGVVCVLATVLPAAALLNLSDLPTALGGAELWRWLGRALLDLTLWAPLGVGVGTLIHSQVAAVVGVLAVTQFVEPTLRMLPMFTGSTIEWIKFLPGAAGAAVHGASFSTGVTVGAGGGGGTGDPLSLGLAVLVMAAWTTLFAALGYATTWRRDVT
ncbi:MAG: hypothetical protein LBO20_09185 [Bifidobacteriaceae bacterium]|jgi:hypothetical protein|nr:hypothetical protein [Bifidobacteriaceae bacterium]